MLLISHPKEWRPLAQIPSELPLADAWSGPADGPRCWDAMRRRDGRCHCDRHRDGHSHPMGNQRWVSGWAGASPAAAEPLAPVLNCERSSSHADSGGF